MFARFTNYLASFTTDLLTNTAISQYEAQKNNARSAKQTKSSNQNVNNDNVSVTPAASASPHANSGSASSSVSSSKLHKEKVETEVERLVAERLEKEKQAQAEQQKDMQAKLDAFADAQKRFTEQQAQFDVMRKQLDAVEKERAAEKLAQDDLKAAHEAAASQIQLEADKKQKAFEERLDQATKAMQAQAAAVQAKLDAAEIETARKLKEVDDARKQEKEKSEAKQKADEAAAQAALNEKLMSLAKERLAELEQEKVVEKQRLKELRAKTKAAPAHLKLDVKVDSEAQQRAKNRDMLIKALRSIIDNPKTIIKPKPAVPLNAGGNIEHYLNEPFSVREAWVKSLPKSENDTLCRIVSEAGNIENPYEINFENFARLLGKDVKTLTDITISLQIDDLDDNFDGVGSRTKRLLHAQNNTAIDRKHAIEESSLICPMEKDHNPLTICFNFDAKSGKANIKEVVQRDASEFTLPLANNLGVTIVAKSASEPMNVIGIAKVKRKK